MTQAERRAQPLAVVYLDLDGFKDINDRYGHGVGDQFLMRVAGRMKQALREGDTIARLGGDEFAMALIDLADAKATEPVLTRVLDATARPITVEGSALRVSASAGVAFYPQAEAVDAEHRFRGGAIMPGRTMQHGALHERTAQLPMPVDSGVTMNSLP